MFEFLFLKWQFRSINYMEEIMKIYIVLQAKQNSIWVLLETLRGANTNKQSLRYLQLLLFLYYIGQASDQIASEKFECKD